MVYFYLLQVHPFHWALSLNWRQGKVLHFDRLVYASSVVISGVLYCGGNFLSACDVIRLSPENRDWSQLPRPHIRGFAMTSLNGQLTIAGGREDTGIRMWDSDSSKWVHPYPPMSTDRWAPAAVGYQNYLIVACGFPNRRDVEVLDSFSGRWYIAQPMPVGGSWISSVVIGDCWYLSSYWKWSDDEEHIFWVHLPTLINSATSAHSNMQRIWCELPTPPVTRPTLLALQGHLLSVGGKGCPQEIYRYDKVASEWKMCGELPVGMCGPCCAVLPSGKVMVAGGITRDTEQVSRRMWLSNV